jgi:hypothetical protein
MGNLNGRLAALEARLKLRSDRREYRREDMPAGSIVCCDASGRPVYVVAPIGAELPAGMPGQYVGGIDLEEDI